MVKLNTLLTVIQKQNRLYKNLNIVNNTRTIMDQEKNLDFFFVEFFKVTDEVADILS